MKALLFLYLLAISLLALQPRPPEDIIQAQRLMVRQPLPPAQDATEWIERLRKDHHHRNVWVTFSWSHVLAHLYAELPPEEHWPEVIAALRQLAPQQDNNPKAQRALLFFAALLQEDLPTAERLMRELVLEKNPTYETSRRTTLSRLLSLSPDKPQTLQWLEKEKPSLLKPITSDSREEKKEKWEILLASDQIEEAVALMLEKASAPNTRTSERHTLYDQLFRIARLLDLSDLKAQSLQGWSEICDPTKKFDDDDELSTYQLSNWLSALSESGQLEQFRERLPAYRKKFDDEWNQKSFALLELHLSAALDPPGFFYENVLQHLHDTPCNTLSALYTFLQDEGFDSTSLGESIVRALITKGEKARAADLALHLLACDPSQDTFYVLLRELDSTRLAAFLPQLQLYDPYEERPLIWQPSSPSTTGSSTKLASSSSAPSPSTPPMATKANTPA